LNEQGAVPVHTIPQPLNVDPAFAAPVSVTIAPFAMVALQPVALQVDQVTPMTEPFPVPLKLSVSG